MGVDALVAWRYLLLRPLWLPLEGKMTSTRRPITLTVLGRRSPQLHATTQRLVLFPCTRSLTAQLSTPAPLRFSTMISTLLYLPSMLVYHWQRSLSTLLSSIIRLTKATSPPGVTISTSAPVQAERGGLDFAAADDRRSDVDE